MINNRRIDKIDEIDENIEEIDENIEEIDEYEFFGLNPDFFPNRYEAEKALDYAIECWDND